MKHSPFLLACAMIVLFGFGCNRTPEPGSNSPQIDREQILFEARKSGLIMNESEIVQMADPTRVQKIDGTSPLDVSAFLKIDTATWSSAALADVTGGGSFGLAFKEVQDGKTTLIAKMGNLPALEEGQSFESWLVQRGKEMKVVRVGTSVTVEDQQVIVFETGADVSEYDFFVLTLNGQHVLEGSFR